MSFLGFMYTSFPKKGAGYFPSSDVLARWGVRRCLGCDPVFQGYLFDCSLASLFLQRGREKPLTAVPGVTVSLPRITKLRVPTRWLWRQAVDSHSSRRGQELREQAICCCLAVFSFPTCYSLGAPWPHPRGCVKASLWFSALGPTLLATRLSKKPQAHPLNWEDGCSQLPTAPHL